jgi:hypothetical protein
MALRCLLLGHKWDGCSCRRCWKDRDHVWGPWLDNLRGKCSSVSTGYIPSAYYRKCQRCGMTEACDHPDLHSLQCGCERRQLRRLYGRM